MLVAIASDHTGYELKHELIEDLKNKGMEVIDFGTGTNESVDYPNYGIKVGEYVVTHKDCLGILICGTGIGMSIACNKVKGVRCGKVSTVEDAFLTRSHNNANVMAFSCAVGSPLAKKLVDTYLTTPFSFDERHIRRIEQITAYENQA